MQNNILVNEKVAVNLTYGGGGRLNFFNFRSTIISSFNYEQIHCRGIQKDYLMKNKQSKELI